VHGARSQLSARARNFPSSDPLDLSRLHLSVVAHTRTICAQQSYLRPQCLSRNRSHFPPSSCNTNTRGCYFLVTLSLSSELSHSRNSASYGGGEHWSRSVDQSIFRLSGRSRQRTEPSQERHICSIRAALVIIGVSGRLAVHHETVDQADLRLLDRRHRARSHHRQHLHAALEEVE